MCKCSTSGRCAGNNPSLEEIDALGGIEKKRTLCQSDVNIKGHCLNNGATENFSEPLEMTRRWATHLNSDYGAVQPMPLEVTPFASARRLLVSLSLRILHFIELHQLSKACTSSAAMEPVRLASYHSVSTLWPA